MLLVERNTLDTAEALGGLVDLANPYSPVKIQRFGRMMAQHLELAPLLARLS
jgi:BioD-like phosphotransacetylase family protein